MAWFAWSSALLHIPTIPHCLSDLLSFQDPTLVACIMSNTGIDEAGFCVSFLEVFDQLDIPVPHLHLRDLALNPFGAIPVDRDACDAKVNIWSLRKSGFVRIPIKPDNVAMFSYGHMLPIAREIPSEAKSI